jgi:hypothetical protein
MSADFVILYVYRGDGETDEYVIPAADAAAEVAACIAQGVYAWI